MRIESRARSRALQALYAWDVRGERDLLRIASQVWDDLAVGPEDAELFAALKGLRGRIAKESKVDGGRGCKLAEHPPYLACADRDLTAYTPPGLLPDGCWGTYPTANYELSWDDAFAAYRERIGWKR